MKILWISPWFGNYRVPVYEELNRLSGGEFYLICSKENTRELVRQKLRERLGDHAIIMEGEQRSTFGSEKSDFANSALVIKKQPGLYKAICRVNPDVLIVEGFGSWSPAGIRYAVTHRRRLCMFYERTFHVERHSPWYRTLYRRLAGLPVDGFVVNGSLTEEYLRRGLGFKRTPITKGCMSADSYGLAQSVATVSKQDKAALHKELGLDSGLTYLFVGQMVERKGLGQLLQAWGEHRKAHPHDNLVAIGQGILLDDYRTSYDGRDGVQLLGAIDYDRLHSYYALCDVFVMPTLEDNWCLVVPEAMACGKPVACSIYNGGCPELIDEGKNGHAFDPLRKESIVEVLDKFHHADLAAMGRRSSEIESGYTPDKAARRIHEACQHACQ